MSQTVSSFGKVVIRDPPPSGSLVGPNQLVLRNSITGEIVVGGSPSSTTEMTPTVAGVAFGSQLLADNVNKLGRGIGGGVDSTGLYLPRVSGTPQATNYQLSTFFDSSNVQDISTSFTQSLASMNRCNISGMASTSSTLLANNSDLKRIYCGRFRGTLKQRQPNHNHGYQLCYCAGWGNSQYM
jgi:hypothetical protein